MEPYLAMKTALVLLGIGAVGGVVMAAIRLRGAPRPPSSFALAHGLLAAAGLTLLIYHALTLGLPQLADVATIVLVLAAVGGTFLNLRYHSQMQPLPVPLMFGHALAAVAGYVLLLMAYLQAPG